MSKLKSIIAVCVIAVAFLSCKSRIEGYKVTPVDLSKVKVTDQLWSSRIERNRNVTIPYTFGKCEETGRIDNFAKAAGLMEGDYEGERYNDSDVYKIFEGACYTLMTSPDERLRTYVDSLALLFAGAQEEDGYLYTNRTVSPDKPAPGAGRDKWIDVWVSHELYNVGHMYEAAVAYYRATGNTLLLEVAKKSANLINNEFGWGKREAAPGHQEIEIGLVKLYEVTGDKRYLELATFFLDVRGMPQEHLEHEPGTRFAVYNDKPYLQQHLPVLEQKEAVGHAVRAAYMYTGMADVSAATGDKRYIAASENLWNDVVSGKIYITGGIGSKEHGEAFGERYELPNMTAYTETCASVANVFWNDRLFRESGDAKYIDVLERTLYNGLISGVALDGTNFFYPNPLESDGRFLRAGWFDCSCCPGNIARFLPQVPQYIYSTSGDDIYVNLYIASEVEIETDAGITKISVETQYPWNGNVKITVQETPGKKFPVRVRIPGWIGREPIPGGLYRFADGLEDSSEIFVNGGDEGFFVTNGYAVIDRMWESGDVINVNLPLRVREVVAREEVEATRDRVAFNAGPVVYCLEETDNGKIRDIVLKEGYSKSLSYRGDLFDGVGIVSIEDDEKKLTAIPYYAWNNRGRGEMLVWIKKDIE